MTDVKGAPDLEELLAEAESRMHRAQEVLRRDLASIRTGRAAPSLLDRVLVEYHGTPTPLPHIASVTAPEPRLLVIQPWDPGTLAAIERAIQKSDLGLNPSNDGNLIRLPIPPLTQERRQELVRLVRKKTEEGRVAVRNVRRDVAEKLRHLEREKQLSADEHKRAGERLQKLTDQIIVGVDHLGQAKESDLLET